MFVDMTLQRNEGLIRAAAILHQRGEIPANTYVIDADGLMHNARVLSETADQHDMKLYYMTKQIGRGGYAGKLIEQNGIRQAVAVDIDEAYALSEAGCRIGNIGHIVQPSKSQWGDVLRQIKPEVVTLFSLERAAQLSEAALALGRVQDVILRVIRPGDTIFPGQFGGFLLHDLEGLLPGMMKLRGIRIVGATSFPVLQINAENTDFAFTPNLETLLAAVEKLRSHGIKVEQVNAPSATTCYTIPLLKRHGVTHGEPGHALTGTTPLHAYNDQLVEIPSIVYVSEISHMDDQYAYTIAGGFYPRSHMQKALYGSTPLDITTQKAKVSQYSAENIDYYGCLDREQPMKVGDTVIYSFRTQIFVTRAHIAYVRGVNSLRPEMVHFQKRGM
ncbi:YhfX family PLP-dependent enzyme [Paenibacillus sp. ISL-20]|uniref:YhfX family PLP-dependent enzyme n=1 Tax=Paenibacillus sp. ISL-20 TaxID=2819163 RepID=UPI001BEAC097|nr:YhfX family PLP-dependent enzyme [Paenibacillus sp. ISL-20]MBT2764599.1 YhfX family PLP-dependent enzyme [Paenibacillus sp. ISL-20]